MHGVEERQRETVGRMRDQLVANRERRAERHKGEEAIANAMYAKLAEKTQEAAKEK